MNHASSGSSDGAAGVSVASGVSRLRALGCHRQVKRRLLAGGGVSTVRRRLKFYVTSVHRSGADDSESHSA